MSQPPLHQPNARAIYEVERDRHGITYSGPLEVGECVQVVLVDRDDTIEVRVEHVEMRGIEREETAHEVIVASSEGDYSWGYWDDPEIAEAEARRLRQMFEVIA